MKLESETLARLSTFTRCTLGGLLLSGAAEGQALLQEHNSGHSSTGYGTALDVIGDVDGDGVDDYVVGNPSHSTTGMISWEGRAEVRSGATGLVIHSVTGAHGLQYLGWAVAGVGDVDQDGIPDFAVSSPFLEQGSISWNPSKPPRTIAVTTPPGFVDVYSGAPGPLNLLAHLTGSHPGDDYGMSLAGGHDWDGDGWLDIVIGATQDPGWGGLGPGKVEVVTLDLQQGPSIVSAMAETQIGCFFGQAVDVGDVTGDGIPDIAVGAPRKLTATGNRGGAAYLYDMANLASPQLIGYFTNALVPGSAGGDEFGRSVCIGPNVETAAGTDWLDLIVGAPYFDNHRGSVHQFSSDTGAELLWLVGESLGHRLGIDLAATGDQNGSGMEEFAIGASVANQVYIISGETQENWSPGDPAISIDQDGALKVRPDHLAPSLASPRPLSKFGRQVVVVGDQDCDGFADLLVAAPTDNQGGPGGNKGVIRTYSVSQGTFTPLAIDTTWGPVREISRSMGGSISFVLDAGSANQGGYFLILGSLSGTVPGTDMWGGCGVLPVTPDDYYNYTVAHPHQHPIYATGVLDGNGVAYATFLLYQNSTALQVGDVIHYAYFVVDPTTGATTLYSNPVGIRIAP